MGSSRTAIVRIIARSPEDRRRYEALFEPLPPVAWIDTLPAQAGPFGDSPTRTAWARLPVNTQRRVNRIYARIGQVIEAYERTLRPEPSAFDRFARALSSESPRTASDELTGQQQRGLALFISDRTRCLRCHNGPMLTNGGFHNIGTGNFTGERLDFGRVFGLQAVLVDEFNCLGPYSAAAPEDCTTLRFVDRNPDAHLEGAFKVPSLRLLSKTAPYFHDGRFDTLTEVVRFYNDGGRVDGVELAPIGLTDDEISDLVAFLAVL